ncbi:putative peptidase [Serratia symbiotica str. 'Cinara cedri']|nr:putative peptidase [Serratia symbiotica str. 'Cinara cedri']
MEQIVQTIFLVYNRLPRIHRIMLGSLTVVTFAITIWHPFIYRLEHDFNIKNVALEARQLRAMQPEASEPIDEYPIILDDEFPEDEFDTKDIYEENMDQYIISSGDTLSSILTQYNIEISDVTLLAGQYRELRNLKIGQQLSWTLDAAGNLQQLRWAVSRREIRIYDRVGNSFKESQKWLQSEWRNSVVSGYLNDSFISSASDAGLSHSEINAVIKALQWQLDFQKLRKGDTFSVLMSREHFNGKTMQSLLRAVRIRAGNKDYYAIRAEDGKFYDREGSGLARGFMRFPTMKQFRISSSFNPRRINPVTGGIAPHKGVDFAMPIGTPVVAVGDGEVLIAKYSGSAGCYLAIRHGHQYTTRYMHLNKLLVKSGQKVKRGERIALSGNSGRSTGPHLHFELWINQQAVNPLTAKLIYSKGLSGKERSTYLVQIRKVISKLGHD